MIKTRRKRNDQKEKWRTSFKNPCWLEEGEKPGGGGYLVLYIVTKICFQLIKMQSEDHSYIFVSFQTLDLLLDSNRWKTVARL